MSALDALALWVGTWTGTGAGRYPTIESFAYRERFRVEIDVDPAIAYYEQRTHLAPDDEQSHWEGGFVRVVEDDAIEVNNAQNGGRVEVLRGRFTDTTPSGFRLELASTMHGNDPRLIATTRTYVLDGDALTYTATMETNTTDTPQMLVHLEATLRRVP